MRGFHRVAAVIAATAFAAAGATMLTATPALAINPCQGNNPPPSCDTGGDSAPPAPTAPTNLTLTGVFQTEIDVRWTDNATTETGYVLSWLDQNTNATGTSTTGANVSTAAITGLSPSHYYTVSLRAQRCTDNGCSVSSTISVVGQLHERPANPRSFLSAGSGNLSYGAYSPTGYALDFDSTAPIVVSLLQDGVDIQDQTANRTYSGLDSQFVGYGDNHGFSFYVHQLATKGNHSLALIARNVAGGSDVQVWGTTYNIPGPPSAATNLVARNTGTSIVVNFTDNANDETGFWLQRSTDNQASWLSVGSQYSPVSGSGSTGTATDYSSPAAGTCYRILMVNSYGNTPSTAVCV